MRQQRQKLWENYFPGSPAILARYKQVRCEGMGGWGEEAPERGRKLAQPRCTLHHLQLGKCTGSCLARG